jgi:hypothetical protein
VELGVETHFQILNDGMIIMERRIYFPKDKIFKNKVLKEAHESRFAAHPGSTKMYKDLKDYY